MSERIRQLRLQHGWSQAELAQAAGISRAAVSAIEGARLAPSVTAALALAGVFHCSVEELFGQPREAAGLEWAWPPPVAQARFLLAAAGGRRLAYPVELTASGMPEHDGVFSGGQFHLASRHSPEKTLIIASCDPAGALLAAETERQTGVRVVMFHRSSRQALALLGKGLVHAAGVHLSTERDPAANQAAARQGAGAETRLLRVARWEDGLALRPAQQCHSVRQILKSGLKIVGREAGSGARQCLDEVLGRRPAPQQIAASHLGVIEAIRAGWADTGPCPRLLAEEAGLTFLSVRREIFDLCFPARDEHDPRIQALIATVRSAAYRRLYGELPGYDSGECGEIQNT